MNQKVYKEEIRGTKHKLQLIKEDEDLMLLVYILLMHDILY